MILQRRQEPQGDIQSVNDSWGTRYGMAYDCRRIKKCPDERLTSQYWILDLWEGVTFTLPVFNLVMPWRSIDTDVRQYPQPIANTTDISRLSLLHRADITPRSICPFYHTSVGTSIPPAKSWIQKRTPFISPVSLWNILKAANQHFASLLVRPLPIPVLKITTRLKLKLFLTRYSMSARVIRSTWTSWNRFSRYCHLLKYTVLWWARFF